MEEGRKKIKHSGIRIVCTIERIEYDEDVDEGHVKLETTKTIDKICTNVRLDKHIIRLPDIGHILQIVPRDDVEIAINEIGAEGAVATINL